MSMLLTLVGLFNLFFCWPIVLLLKLAKIETLTILSNEYADIELSIKFMLSLVVASALGLGKSASLTTPVVKWSTSFIFPVFIVYTFIMLYGSLVTQEIYLKVGCFLTIPVSAGKSAKIPLTRTNGTEN